MSYDLLLLYMSVSETVKEKITLTLAIAARMFHTRVRENEGFSGEHLLRRLRDKSTKAHFVVLEAVYVAPVLLFVYAGVR